MMNLTSSESPMPYLFLLSLLGIVLLQVQFSPKIDRSAVNIRRNDRDLDAGYKEVLQLQKLQMRNC